MIGLINSQNKQLRAVTGPTLFEQISSFCPSIFTAGVQCTYNMYFGSFKLRQILQVIQRVCKYLSWPHLGWISL
jgi:hypothetical protein